MNIGIPASKSKTQYFLNQAYVSYVSAAGYTPIMITPEMSNELVLSICDGLLLAGGIDLDPTYYGQHNFCSFIVDPEKDDFERNLFHLFREAVKPVFGICRGLQLIICEYKLYNEKFDNAVIFRQDIAGHNQSEPLKLERNVHSHFVGRDHVALYGREDARTFMAVNSMHHQAAVADVVAFGKSRTLEGAKIVAWTDKGLSKDDLSEVMLDGRKTPKHLIIEAITINNAWAENILAVQWHPEELKDTRLLTNFFGQKQQGVVQDGYKKQNTL